MKTFLISTAAACLTLCIGVSAQGDAFAYTPLDVPGASSTVAYGIDGGNIVGFYYDGSYNYHGFSYDGTPYTTFDVPGASNGYATGIDGNNTSGTARTAAALTVSLPSSPNPRRCCCWPSARGCSALMSNLASISPRSPAALDGGIWEIEVAMISHMKQAEK